MPIFAIRANTQQIKWIQNNHYYLDCFMVMTVSQSPSSALTYIPTPLHDPDCLIVSTLTFSCDCPNHDYIYWSIHFLVHCFMKMDNLSVILGHPKAKLGLLWQPFVMSPVIISVGIGILFLISFKDMFATLSSHITQHWQRVQYFTSWHMIKISLATV